ncbi:MAG: methanethiol S-methyltransferase [Pseudomonadota bacterium]
MQRFFALAYGLISYAVFFAVFLYSIGFIGNLWVPKSIDSAPTMGLVPALLINMALLGVFAVQHSLMARPFFKRAWTKIIPQALERSTYVLASSIAMIVLFVGWQPMGGVIWEFGSGFASTLMLVIYAAGWGLLLYSTFAIDHFDLFGLRQVWLHFRGRPYEPPKFVQPALYRVVRHPLYVGWLLIFWATPTMTVAHLVFAVLTTVYILLAIQWEEADLIREHAEYANYQREVPMLIPRVSPRQKPTSAAQ